MARQPLSRLLALVAPATQHLPRLLEQSHGTMPPTHGRAVPLRLPVRALQSPQRLQLPRNRVLVDTLLADLHPYTVVDTVLAQTAACCGESHSVSAAVILGASVEASSVVLVVASAVASGGIVMEFEMDCAPTLKMPPRLNAIDYGQHSSETLQEGVPALTAQVPLFDVQKAAPPSLTQWSCPTATVAARHA